MPAGTTNFPGAVDSHTGGDPLGFAQVNNLAATLTTTSHTNSVTTITVASTSAFESRGYIKIKREIISYTGKTATTFTGCTRAADGTSAAAYLAGTVVEQVVVAANHNDLAAGLVAVETKVGTGSSTPTASKVLGADGTGTSSWRQVATGDIAAGAVTQRSIAVGSSVGPTTTSASYGDITDMSVTMTTAGGDLLVIMTGTFTVAASSTAAGFALSLDGAAEVAPALFQNDNAVTYSVVTLMHLFTGVSAASHTVKGRWYVNGGATLTAYNRYRSLLVMEVKR